MSEDALERFVRLAVIFSIVLATMVAVALLYFGRPVPYSAVFIVPGSYENYIGNASSVSFAWGILSFEQGSSRYTSEFFIGNSLVKKQDFTLAPGEYRLNETLLLPANISFPETVRISLTVDNRVYDAHYWIKGRD